MMCVAVPGGYDADQSYDLPTYGDEEDGHVAGAGAGPGAPGTPGAGGAAGAGAGAGAGAEGGGVGGYRPLEPVQAPIAPPYKTAIAREKERDRK
jgi:hypothetical protein